MKKILAITLVVCVFLVGCDKTKSMSSSSSQTNAVSSSKDLVTFDRDKAIESVLESIGKTFEESQIKTYRYEYDKEYEKFYIYVTLDDVKKDALEAEIWHPDVQAAWKETSESFRSLNESIVNLKETAFQGNNSPNITMFVDSSDNFNLLTIMDMSIAIDRFNPMT